MKLMRVFFNIFSILVRTQEWCVLGECCTTPACPSVAGRVGPCPAWRHVTLTTVPRGVAVQRTVTMMMCASDVCACETPPARTHKHSSSPSPVISCCCYYPQVPVPLLHTGRRVTAGRGDLQCLWPLVSHCTALLCAHNIQHFLCFDCDVR